MRGARAPVLPFNVLTGFLGAGKTTLLNALLKHPGMDGTLVIVNEFGEVGLDHLLVEASADEVIELSSGCLCCVLRGDLVETLVRVLQAREEEAGRRFGRIVVETSGLADPAPILHSVMGHPWLTERLALDGVAAVIDALNGPETLKAHPEALKQAALADRLVIAKADMLEEPRRERRLAALRAALREINPAADILLSGEAAGEPGKLFHAGLIDAASGEVRLDGWLRMERLLRRRGSGERAHGPGHEPGHGHERSHGHDREVESFALIHEAALQPLDLEIFIDLLRANFGAGLLRVKGIVKLTDDPARPVVVHGVQHIFHPPARLGGWPGADRSTRMVFITRGGLRGRIRELFSAIVDPLSGGGAARADDSLSLLPDGDA